MGLFVYKTKDGELVEELFPTGKVPREIVLPDGRKAKRDIGAEALGWGRQSAKKPHGDNHWPRTSTSAGCEESGIDRMEQASRDAGCPTKFVRTGENKGDAILESPQHKREYFKFRGFDAH